MKNLRRQGYCCWIQISVSSLIWKAPHRRTQARSQSSTTAQNSSLPLPLRRRKRVSCHHFCNTGRWWILEWLSFNFHATISSSSYLTVIMKLGASCYTWIGQWREDLSKCYLQILSIRSEVKHLNYKFNNLPVWKSSIFYICAKIWHINMKKQQE